MRKVKALVVRTKMIGGGTSYDVLVPKSAKSYQPISHGIYATTVIRSGDGPDDGYDGGYYSVSDFLRTKELDNMPIGEERYQSFNALREYASELELIAAKSVYPELMPLDRMPPLWTSETHVSDERWAIIEFPDECK